LEFTVVGEKTTKIMIAPPKQTSNPLDFKQLFIHQLNRVNCTKGYLIRNLPILEGIASFKNMKLAIQEDLDDVKKQQKRIDKIYAMLHSKASDEGCDVIKSVIEEAFNLNNNSGKSTIINDMDIILYMQLIENIELTSFRMLKLISGFIGNDQITQMVTECFDENVDNDKLFSLITEEYLSKKSDNSN
jgi:ferritin-like metal-binding protein YciE